MSFNAKWASEYNEWKSPLTGKEGWRKVNVPHPILSTHPFVHVGGNITRDTCNITYHKLFFLQSTMCVTETFDFTEL